MSAKIKTLPCRLVSFRIAHIINPVAAESDSAFYAIQQITFQSMLNAKRFSLFASASLSEQGANSVIERSRNNRQIDLYTTQYAEDHAIIPADFKVLDDLQRSVLDFGTFAKQRKLPLIADILSAVEKASEADYFVFTNMDIGLMPSFYETIFREIENRHDAILITRRRISKQYNSVSQLSEIYADTGKPHPGYDTFVFHRSLLKKFVLSEICVGVPFLEVSLLHNLIAFAQNLKLIDRAHLTFHIGMEVMPPVDAQFYWHNRNAYQKKILPAIKPFLVKEKFPYANESVFSRWTKWTLNPCYRSALMAEMETMSFFRKIKFLIDEVRWRILQGN